MKVRTLGTQGLKVSAVGLGCMGMSHGYAGAVQESEAISTMHLALELGCDFWDTAEVYGPFTNEVLVGKALKGRRDKVVVATKFGFGIAPPSSGLTGPSTEVGLDSRPEHIRAVVEASLKRLDIDVIDLLYQHRVDPNVPIEDVVGAMADLVQQGKVRFLGLSEPSAATLKRAHAVHPISAVQSEYSLWSRDVEQTTIPTCRALGVGLVPYSPLGRGALTGKLPAPDALGAGDFRIGLPRFQADAWDANQALLAKLQAMAQERHCTSAQLALAWVLAQGDFIVPIPGASKERHLRENLAAAEISLSAQDVAEIGNAMHPSKVQGDRYTEASLALTNR